MRRVWPWMVQRLQKWRCAPRPPACFFGRGGGGSHSHTDLCKRIIALPALPTVLVCTALPCALVLPQCRTTTTRMPRSLWGRRMTMRPI
jgi:hypothetical protein